MMEISPTVKGRGGSEPKKGVHSFLPTADDPPPGRSTVEIRSLYHYVLLSFLL